MDLVEEILPAECEHCQKPLTAGGNPEEGKYFRYQVLYIPEAKRHVTEYRLRCIRCECGADTWAEVPHIARSGFGTRLTAFAAYLTGVYRVTRRDLWFGNQSQQGELLNARLPSVTRTCPLQGQNPVQYLVQALNAYLRGLVHPSLVNASR